MDGLKKAVMSLVLNWISFVYYMTWLSEELQGIEKLEF